MLKDDAQEAADLVERTMLLLLNYVPTRGRAGSDARTACGQLIVNAEKLCRYDIIGIPLDNCFDLARQAGMTLNQMDYVRTKIVAETPVLLGAVMIKNAEINLCLAQETLMLADTEFHSRQDVDDMKTKMNAGFNLSEEVAADDMAQMTYQKLVALHAAVSFYLIETGRPLPRLMQFRFSETLPSLVLSYKLYDIADRGDEVRVENKIVHPAFMQRIGRALSN
jgi:prophage DNA circulation protein